MGRGRVVHFQRLSISAIISSAQPFRIRYRANRRRHRRPTFIGCQFPCREDAGCDQ
jgi:hypothetical protein